MGATPEVHLHLGDCLDVMRGLEAGSVDAVVTDPPYGVNLGLSWDTWPGPKPWAEIARVLKPSGVLAFFIAPHVADERLPDVKAAGFKTLEVGFWVYGTGRPVHKARLKRNYDLVYFMSRTGRELEIEGSRLLNMTCHTTGRVGQIKPINSPSIGPQFGAGRRGRRVYIPGAKAYWPSNVACEDDNPALGEYTPLFAVKRLVERGAGDKKHPTAKPLALVAQVITLVSKPGDCVLDPFMGGGTTGAACVLRERAFIGTELDSGYFKLARKRIEEAQMQTRMDL